MTRPAPTRRQGAAFVVATHGHKRRLHEAASAAGLDWSTAVDCMATEVGAGRMKVRDEIRTDVWLEVLCVPSWAWPECREAAAQALGRPINPEERMP